MIDDDNDILKQIENIGIWDRIVRPHFGFCDERGCLGHDIGFKSFTTHATLFILKNKPYCYAYNDKCSAWYYIGERYLWTGDKNTGRQHLSFEDIVEAIGIAKDPALGDLIEAVDGQTKLKMFYHMDLLQGWQYN